MSASAQKNNFFSNPWVVGISCSLIAGIVLMLVPASKSYILKFLKNIMHWLLSDLHFSVSIPHWSICLLVILIVLVIFLKRKNIPNLIEERREAKEEAKREKIRKKIDKSFDKLNREFPQPEEPEWMAFRSHIFKEVFWKWIYPHDFETGLFGMIPVCPLCYSNLIIGKSRNIVKSWRCTNLECKNNGSERTWKEPKEMEIEGTIRNLIASGNYKEYMDKQIPPEYL